MRCYSPSPYARGAHCQLKSGHEHTHMDENDETWIEDYDPLGIEMFWSLNDFRKAKGFRQLFLTPELCKELGKLFEEVADACEYHHYDECDHSSCHEDHEPMINEGYL